MDETDDPSANTQMFRAFVEQGTPPPATETATNRTPWIVAGIAAALIVVVVVALAML
ncbi:MAG TPA: hypothetical protein VIL48_20360 [Acidimicrobiales bacterium]